ncbi:choline/carnitine O-acyltransferase [[Mycoplasma] collis]|uniref:choline/carnitine O-acyltransferase n=1 Tax=[Mycoplasma] collis TaxID=2127 RepID=UPI00068C9EE4|nr:choline/carnitine O-acyltransferase [[Mycoplasma] collis]
MNNLITKNFIFLNNKFEKLYKNKNVDNLPNLPIEKAQEWTKRFLEWVKPLISKQDYIQTEKEVKNYLNGESVKKIYKLLEKKQKNKNDNWLAKWWIYYGYLTTRKPVMPEVNAPFYVKFTNNKKIDSISKKAAFITYNLVDIYLKWINNELNSYLLNNKKNVSLDGLTLLFKSGRIRQENIDDIYFNDKDNIKHIVVVKNNLFYKIEVIDENNKILNYGDILKQFESVNSNRNKSEYNYNFLTIAMDTKESQDLFNLLINQNKNEVKDILDSLFIINLDNNKYQNPLKILKSASYDKNFNRWHGKGLQVIINKKNEVVFLPDHSLIDGANIATISEIIDDNFKKEIIIEKTEKPYEPELIKFKKIDNKELKNFENIWKKYQKYVQEAFFDEIKISTLSKAKLKELGILNSEAFIQLIYQISQLKTNKKIQNTYMAVDMRSFYRGRTECIRPISLQSKKLSKLFLENGKKAFANFWNIYPEIEKYHFERSKLAQKGAGINRIMLGNYLIWYENQENILKPKLFETKAWKIISSNPLSTSTIVHKNLKYFLFNPVEKKGIGIAYALDENYRAIISVFNKNKKYLQEFKKNFVETIKIFLKKIKKKSN